MSGKSCASGSERSGGSARLTVSHELVLDALYERKRDKKSVRVLTVIVYVFCVSLAAIMLSLYYVFFWEPKDTAHAQRQVSHTIETPTPLPTCFLPHTGRSNITVSEDTNSTVAADLAQIGGNNGTELEFEAIPDYGDNSTFAESTPEPVHNDIT